VVRNTSGNLNTQESSFRVLRLCWDTLAVIDFLRSERRQGSLESEAWSMRRRRSLGEGSLGAFPIGSFTVVIRQRSRLGAFAESTKRFVRINYQRSTRVSLNGPRSGIFSNSQKHWMS
jgi:hypothetical protein